MIEKFSFIFINLILQQKENNFINFLKVKNKNQNYNYKNYKK